MEVEWKSYEGNRPIRESVQRENSMVIRTVALKSLGRKRERIAVPEGIHVQ